MLKIMIETMTMLAMVNSLLRGRLEFMLGMILTRR